MKDLAMQRAGAGPGWNVIPRLETLFSGDVFKDGLSIALRRSCGNFDPQVPEK
jgi:hypothetical protein